VAEEKKPDVTPFSVERIYVRDISFEAPAVPDVFAQPAAQSDLNVQLSIRHRPLKSPANAYEVVLDVSVKATSGDKTVFLVEVQQAGLFTLPPLEAEMLERVLEIECAYVLLPFARETINDLAGKGGFPQLLITPINFAALHAQKQASKKQQQVQ